MMEFTRSVLSEEKTGCFGSNNSLEFDFELHESNITSMLVVDNSFIMKFQFFVSRSVDKVLCVC